MLRNAERRASNDHTYGKGFSWMAMQERKVRKFKAT
jgi:hypothetical protein